MSIASEITRITDNVSDSYTAANAKGATMPATQDSDHLAATIATIPSGVTPTGTMYIISNGTYNVEDKAIANVNVPTTAPAHYIEKSVDANGKAINSSVLMNFNGITDVGNNAFANIYNANTAISGTVDMSDLTTISGSYACNNMFYGCTGLTSVDLSALTTISGSYACLQMFYGCTGLTSADLSALTTVSDSYACNSMFYNCTGLTSADLSALTTVSGQNACNTMFYGCTGLTSADLSTLTTISGSYACGSMFQNCTGIASADLSALTTVDGASACYNTFGGCTGLTSVDLSALTTVKGGSACWNMFKSCTRLTSVDLSGLTTISGNSACGAMFQGCTSLATVSIGGTTAIDFGTQTNQFMNMFGSCAQNIDVYAPAANQSQIEAFSGYPNFGGTGTVTWHWRS